MNKVDLEFIKRPEVDIRPSGLWFVMPLNTAIEYVHACQKEKIKILGIDGFYLQSLGIQPSMENSIDFSSQIYKPETDIYAAAIKFLKARPVSMYFEIVSENEVP
jgi:hypothetical protein